MDALWNKGETLAWSARRGRKKGRTAGGLEKGTLSLSLSAQQLARLADSDIEGPPTHAGSVRRKQVEVPSRSSSEWSAVSWFGSLDGRGHFRIPRVIITHRRPWSVYSRTVDAHRPFDVHGQHPAR